MNKLETGFYYLCIAGFSLPLLPNFIRNVIIALLVLMTILGLLDKQTRTTRNFKLVFLGASLYAIYLFSLLYTNNIEVGVKKIETGLSLALFPFVYSFIPVKTLAKLKSNLSVLFSIYVGCVLISLILFFAIFLDHYGSSLFQHFPTVINKDLGPYNIHPIYLSMHGGIAILFSLYLLSKSKRVITTLCIIISSLIIVAFMLVLIKKGPILSLVIAGAYYVFEIKSKKAWVVLGVLSIVFATVIILHPKVNSKFSELLRIGDEDNKEMTSTNIRLTIYNCGKQLIPEAGLFGYGVGDAKDVLMNCYSKTNTELKIHEYNSHNQYLSIILRAGFLGLACFVCYILFILFNLKKQNGFIAIAIILFYILVMFSENILERENGVVYFSFFTTVLFVIFTAQSGKKDLLHEPH